MTGVKDIVDEQYVSIGDVEHHLGINGQRTAFGALVAAGLDNANAKWHFQLSYHIGQQNNATGQDADNRKRLVLVMLVDRLCQIDDTLIELLFVKKDFHGELSVLNFKSHILSQRSEILHWLLQDYEQNARLV